MRASLRADLVEDTLRQAVALRGELPGSGATPCMDLFTLDAFMRTLDGHAMQTCVEDRAG